MLMTGSTALTVENAALKAEIARLRDSAPWDAWRHAEARVKALMAERDALWAWTQLHRERHRIVQNDAGDDVCFVCGHYWPCAEHRAFAALRDTAPAEGFFARGEDGQYHPDPAPAEAALRVHSAEMLRVEREWADRLGKLGQIIKNILADAFESDTPSARQKLISDEVLDAARAVLRDAAPREERPRLSGESLPEAVNRLRAERERTKAALRAWRHSHSLPDCPACSVLDAHPGSALLDTPPEDRSTAPWDALWAEES